MARAHASACRPSLRSRALAAGLGALVVTGGVVFSPLPAAADPEPPANATEAQRLVAEKARELEIVSERVNEARERLRRQQAAADAAEATVAEALEDLDDARQQVRTVARSAWTGRQLTALNVMLSAESPEDLLDRVGTLDTIARYNGGVLTEATAADAEARQARERADEAAAEAFSLVQRVAAQQEDLDRQVEEYKADYERLLAEERAAREAAERAARERATTDRASRDDRPSTASTPAPVRAPAPVAAGGGGSGTARAAVSAALAQVGDPYSWGAGGPNAFDCSGLTMFAYRAAGVSLPHSSRMQSTMGTAVSRSAMQPGDLLFYYSPVSHVSMYIGNGQMVHASTYGQPVKVVPISSMPDFHTVRRIA